MTKTLLSLLGCFLMMLETGCAQTTSVTLDEGRTYPSAGQGINIGTQNYYDSYILKNLASLNPGFQPMTNNVDVTVSEQGTTTTFQDSDSYSQIAVNQFAGGSGYYACVGSQFTGSVQHCSGSNYGSTFVIVSNTAAIGGKSGATFTISCKTNCSGQGFPANPQKYDSIFVYSPRIPTTAAELNLNDFGWEPAISGTGSVAINTDPANLVPVAVQCLELSTGPGGGTAGARNYFDSQNGQLNYAFNGRFTQSISARILSGSGMTLTMAVQRSGGVSAANTVVLRGSGYRTYSTSFTGFETGSTPPSSVVISYSLSGPAGSSVCLNNAQLVSAADTNPSLFRDQIQSDLVKTMDAGEVRFSWPVNGDTLINMLTPQESRFGTSGEGGLDYQPVGLGLHDFLTAMKDFGVRQVWLSVPATFRAADGVNLTDYLAAPSGGANAWANLRARLGQPVPWTKVFKRIVVEYCNECWNAASGNLAMPMYRGGANAGWNYIPLVIAFDHAMKSDANWDGSIMKTAAGLQTAIPYFGKLLAAADTDRSVDVVAANEYGMHTVTNCTPGAEFQSATTEAWADAFDPHSASGYYQSSKNGRQIETYEGQNSTESGSCSQSQLTGLPEGEGYALTDTLMPALANKQFGVLDWDFFVLFQHRTEISTSQGRASIADWGIMTGPGGAYNNPRPAAYAMGMLNACMNLGTGYAAKPSWAPKFDYNGGNGINNQSDVPLLQFAAYMSGPRRCIVAWNTDYNKAHSFVFRGANPPRGRVTVTTLTASSTTASNETRDSVPAVAPKVTTVLDPASFTLAPFSMETISYSTAAPSASSSNARSAEK